MLNKMAQAAVLYATNTTEQSLAASQQCCQEDRRPFTAINMTMHQHVMV
jgi:hypothetical protein